MLGRVKRIESVVSPVAPGADLFLGLLHPRTTNSTPRHPSRIAATVLGTEEPTTQEICDTPLHRHPLLR
jgi:hypothetical protein